MTRFVYLLLFMFSILRPMLAQSITGAVREADNKPASFAALKLFRATDSSFVQGAVSDDKGSYSFANLPNGTYRVQASMVGMTTIDSPVATVRAGQPVVLEPLTLRPANQLLTAVTVRAQRAFVEQQPDKTVLNVAENATAQGKTAYELLQQAPGVVIDPNDNIRMAGKQGATVFIDGKPTNLSATDLANLLRATPASTIATVELITNPSARYDAQGGAGIINIRLRRDKALGLNGNASGGYGQSDHHRASAAVDLNYRAKRLNLFGNVAGSDNNQITNVSMDRQAGRTQFLQRGYDTDATRAIVYKTGTDYFIGTNGSAPRHTVGVVVSGNAATNRFGTYTTTNLVNSRGLADTSIVNRVTNPSKNNRINAALNYRYADTLGLEISLDADFTRFASQSPSQIGSDYANADGKFLFRQQNRFEATTGITIVTLKGDLVKIWKASRTKLETGFKHTDVTTDNDLLVYTGVADAETPDLNRTNRFTYRETVQAAYASLNRSLGKQLTVQAGLRAEHATVRGRSVDLRSQSINRPDTNYLNLFPTVFVQYQATASSQFSVNYGQRIGRPNYQDLNPFIYQVDPYTSQRGNPYLRPTYTHNAELSYTYKWATTLKLAYSRINDFSTDVVRQDGLTTYQTVANVGRVDALNLSFSTPLTIAKWWSTYTYAGATWNRFRGNLSVSEPFDQRAFAFEGYMQHSFTLSKNWSGQVSGFWNAPTRQTIYRIGGLGAVNISVQKKVLQDRGKITLGIDDILNTMHWRRRADFAPNGGSDYSQQFTVDRKWESRRASIRFSYRFGRSEIKAARNRETGTDAGRIKVKGNQ